MPIVNTFSNGGSRAYGFTSGNEAFELTWSPAPAGTVFTTGSYTGVDFTASATVTIAGGGKDIEYVVVGGGGRGGTGSYPGNNVPNTTRGGGGGAGGYRNGTLTSLAKGVYTVTVGAARNSSVFGPIIAAAGGDGGGSGAGLSGGSGGGGAGRSYGNSPQGGGSGNSPSTSPPQGNPGGLGTAHTYSPASPFYYTGGAGGGGGATAGGSNGATDGTACTNFGCFPLPQTYWGSGSGGAGVDSLFKGPGSPVKLAGGGGGSGTGSSGASAYAQGWPGSGGPGGGGVPPATKAGVINTGGGGGGGQSMPGEFSPNPAGTGSSGRVMIRWVAE
jgi:hypothetical protein